MSFFIAYFPFDFECAKVQQFIGMTIDFGKNFYSTKQITVYQYFNAKNVLDEQRGQNIYLSRRRCRSHQNQ